MEEEQVQREVARANLYWKLGPDKAKVTAKLQQEFFHPGEQATVRVEYRDRRLFLVVRASLYVALFRIDH